MSEPVVFADPIPPRALNAIALLEEWGIEGHLRQVDELPGFPLTFAELMAELFPEGGE